MHLSFKIQNNLCISLYYFSEPLAKMSSYFHSLCILNVSDFFGVAAFNNSQQDLMSLTVCIPVYSVSNTCDLQAKIKAWVANSGMFLSPHLCPNNFQVSSMRKDSKEQLKGQSHSTVQQQSDEFMLWLPFSGGLWKSYRVVYKYSEVERSSRQEPLI